MLICITPIIAFIVTLVSSHSYDINNSLFLYYALPVSINKQLLCIQTCVNALVGHRRRLYV